MTEDDKFAHKKGKGVISERKNKGKAKPADKDLSFWTGTGQVLDSWAATGHVQIQPFHEISRVSGLEIAFCCNFIIVLHGFGWRSPKTN